VIKTIHKSILLQLFIIILFHLFSIKTFAKKDATDTSYISIEPVIITNYLRKSARKPGFIQMKAQLSVTGKEAAKLVSFHMPLIKDYIIEFLSFTSEKTIKDISKRSQLRASMSTGIQELLIEHTGAPQIEELVITHFMWD